MALFNKFFQSNKRKNSIHGDSTKRQQQFPSNQTSNESCIFPFSSEQVRVVLFRECDWTGRRLLFDSSAVQKVSLATNNQTTTTTSPSPLFTSSSSSSSTSSNNRSEKLATSTESNGSHSTRSYIDICNGYGYTYDQASCETNNNIGEMVFGSVAMSFKGTSLKVHWLREPTRILCSQVFLSPIYPNTKAICTSSSSSSNASSVTDLKTNEKGNVPTNSSNSSFSLSLSVCMTKKLCTPNGQQLQQQLKQQQQQQEHQQHQPVAITTLPLDVPPPPPSSSSSSFDHPSTYGCDSGFSGTDMWTTMSSSSLYGYRSDQGSSVVSTFSTDPSISSSRKLSVDSAILVDAAINGRSSDGCLQRRIQRNRSTSFENSLAGSDFIGYFDECRINHRLTASIPGSMVRRHSVQCNETRSNPEIQRRRKNSGKESLKPPTIHFSSYTPRSKMVNQRRSKIGLAVCIRFSESAEEEMQLFCSEHIALLESMLCRLRAAAETAFLNQKRFHQLMLHAWIATTSWITDLFTAPRIKEPVWFSLSNNHCDRPYNLAKYFMSELCWLLNSADTKDTNFFVSTLLTAILTNHLGWVATVAPIINSSACNDQMMAINQNQAKMSEISKFHPYNVLWAQLGDLYGSIGSPSRLAKTIVCGSHTVTINKVLSILTYFVRCGEIQRVNSTKSLNEAEIEELMSNQNQRHKVFTSNVNNAMPSSLPQQQFQSHEFKPIVNTVKGLSRSKTCLKEITTACHDKATQPQPMNKNSSSSDSFAHESDAKIHDFSFHQPQYEFDATEINFSNSKDTPATTNNNLTATSSMIKLMVTSPNNDRFEYETAAEAIDFILKKVDTPTMPVAEIKYVEPFQKIIDPVKIDVTSNECKSRRSLWRIDPVKDGISIDKWKSITNDEIDNVQIKNADLKRSHSLKTKVNPLSGLRRSKTFREVNMSDWNNSGRSAMIAQHYPKISTNMEMSTLASQVQTITLKNGTKCIATNEQQQALKPAESVVFVLGDNEVLSGLKTPPPSSPKLLTSEKYDIQSKDDATNAKDQQQQSEPIVHTKPSNSQTNGGEDSNSVTKITSSSSSTTANEAKIAEASSSSSSASATSAATATTVTATNSNDTTTEKKKKHCTHKKHSGVKFNFEQYPQIVTNYMKNKNLDITSYDFLEKGLKLEQENAFNYGASSTTSFLPMFAPEHVHHELDEREEEEQCECCANTFHVLQTPSNATELEFSNDDDAIYPVPLAAQTIPKQSSSTVDKNVDNNLSIKNSSNENESCSLSVTEDEANKIKNDKDNDKMPVCKVESNKNEANNGDRSTIENISNCTSTRSKNYLDLITLPIPKTEFIGEARKCGKIRPGYVPSLFIGITDHFIPDMVLQGITAPVHTWEPILRQNLALASHCATFEQTPTENVAIIANIEKWDVKLVSSQAYALSTNSLNGPIGMSQLVSTMLETVHAMWMAGTSAPQCMSFLESKLKEIYLQSETLAAFLLATEFCSLNTVTTALNLSANDVPLLLSVASIHSPQVTKKYGISFR